MSESDHENPDPLGFSSVAKGLQENFKCVEEIVGNYIKSQEYKNTDPLTITETYTHWLQVVQQDPQRIFDANMDFLSKSLSVSQ